MNRQHYINFVSWLYIALWGYAGAIKLINWDTSRREMQLQPFPHWVGDILFWFIPLLELTLVVFLLQARTRMRALQSSITLLSTFTLYILLVLGRAFGKIPCACGGILSGMGHFEHLYFNLAFIILGWIAMIWTHRSQKQERARSIFSQEGGELER